MSLLEEMFILNSLLLLISVMIVTIIPFLFPFVVGLIWTLLHNHSDPSQLVFIAMSWSLFMWYFRYYSNEKIFQRIAQKLSTKNKKKPNLMLKLEWYLHTANISYIIWIVIAIAAWSGFPDILTVRIVHNKVNIYQWLSAYIIWKLFLYLPLIYGWDILLKFISQ